MKRSKSTKKQELNFSHRMVIELMLMTVELQSDSIGEEINDSEEKKGTETKAEEYDIDYDRNVPIQIHQCIMEQNLADQQEMANNAYYNQPFSGYYQGAYYPLPSYPMMTTPMESYPPHNVYYSPFQNVPEMTQMSYYPRGTAQLRYQYEPHQ